MCYRYRSPGRFSHPELVAYDVVWQNARGDRVDPVPFLVTSLLAAMIVFAFGPIYAMEYGIGLASGIAISTGLTTALVGAAYHRLVWRARPEMRGEIPPEVRIRQLFYGVIAGILLLSALSYPIFVGH